MELIIDIDVRSLQMGISIMFMYGHFNRSIQHQSKELLNELEHVSQIQQLANLWFKTSQNLFLMALGRLWCMVPWIRKHRERVINVLSLIIILLLHYENIILVKIIHNQHIVLQHNVAIPMPIKKRKMTHCQYNMILYKWRFISSLVWDEHERVI